MPGRNARSVRCIDLTLTSNEKSQSSSEHSSAVPWCTKPAALSRMSMLPTRFAVPATAAVSRTSSRATSDTPSSLSEARPFSSISVAKTLAPSRAKAMAQARPMPAAPAVTNARLPLRRSPIYLSLNFGLPRRSNPDCLRGEMDCFAPFAMTAWSPQVLMIVPRHTHFAGNVVIAGGQLHAGPSGMLADRGSIELLPGCLVGRVRKAAFGRQFCAPLLQLLIGYQDVGAALVEIDANLVAVLEDRKPAISGGFRCGVQDRWRARGAGLAAIADARQRKDAPLDQ